MKRLLLLILLFNTLMQLCIGQEVGEFGELYEPQPVVFTFETLGWKLLVCLVILTLIIACVLWGRKRIRNKYRREALRELQNLPLEHESVLQILVTLKRVAIMVFGRQTVAALNGHDWLQFLDKTGKEVMFQKYEAVILNSVYTHQTPNSDEIKEIFNNATKWIKTHASKL